MKNENENYNLVFQKERKKERNSRQRDRLNLFFNYLNSSAEMGNTIRGTVDEWYRIKPLYPNNKTIEDRISGDRSVSFYPGF